MWKTLIDTVFPIKCLGCGVEGVFLCLDCFRKIPLNQNSSLKLNRNQALNELIISSYYQNPLLKNLIHRYKYDFIKDLADPLSKLMAQKIYYLKQNPSIVLTPVPLHKKRLKWRGFNHSEILAQKTAQKLDLAFLNNLITRKKHTIAQASIQDKEIRKRNLKNVFEINPESDTSLIENKTIILIDDIYTTGSTLNECAKTLKHKTKSNQIKALVLAKG